MKKKRQSRIQVFNLKDEGEAKSYYNLLERITANKVKVPILAKGFMRMVDFSKQIKKLDFYPPFEQYMTRQERTMLKPLLAD
ncbi:MAG: hypothetical protein QXH80_01465 [Candidatus Nanoarchaeia archaeon]